MLKIKINLTMKVLDKVKPKTVNRFYEQFCQILKNKH